VNVNSFPNHAFRIRVVNAIRNEKKTGEIILRVTMENIYGMLMHARYLKMSSKTQIVKDLGKFCKYHCQYGHDIDFYDKFHQEVKKMMILRVLRIGYIKIDSEIRMIVS
jgi:hypothetical protein